MPVGGKFTARQKEIYDIVLGAQRAAAAAFVAGKMKLGNVSQRGADVTDTLDKVAFTTTSIPHGKDLHGEPLGKYFSCMGLVIRSGINVHYQMDNSKHLDKWNVFTIEPGINIPGGAARSADRDDVFYVDNDGKLTVDLVEKLPHDAADVESAMRR